MKTYLSASFILLLILHSQLPVINGQQYAFSEQKLEKVVWCTKSLQEFYKCGNVTRTIEKDHALFDDLLVNLTCLLAYSSNECINYIDKETADITTLDAGDIYSAGRYHSIIPIMQEKYEGGFTNYYSVAVIKHGSIPEVRNLRHLKSKKVCFPWVGSLAGWIIPIYILQREGGMDIVDCNNRVKTAANYFNISCAVNSLIDKYNPIGDNSDKLCSLCAGKFPKKCSTSDPYFGYDGAFKCLVEAGDIAFLKHTTVNEMIDSTEFKHLTTERFELLCRNGERKPLSEYRQCNWGRVPSDAIVTLSAKTLKTRTKYQKFFQRLVQIYSIPDVSEKNKNDKNNLYNNKNNNRDRYNDYSQDFSSYNNDDISRNFNEFTTSQKNLIGNINQTYESFNIFESKRYNKRNLLFQDTTRSLTTIAENDQSFAVYLEQSLEYINGVLQCPVSRMTLCITSDAEMEKCIKMRTALKAQNLKPNLVCYKAHSHINCMHAIQTGVADVTVFDAGDVYTSGLKNDLIPFMSEVYDLGEPEYYVVAVAKEEDKDTQLNFLKGKNTCHAGIHTAAGWTYPLAHLLSNAWIRPYGCDSIRAAAEYFSKSCVPGAISSEYNTGVPYDNMCDLCHGTSFRYCRRDSSEIYYGHTGALRCLAEGGGDVAFVKHTTVNENTGGKRKEWWARDTLKDDFELLCLDGTRAELDEYKKCNLGKVKANAIVTRGGYGYNETEVNAYINLFMYAQKLYGRKDEDTFSFSMFSSPYQFYDLIFQDATLLLRVIEKEKRRYDLYLGNSYMRARRITDCHAGSNIFTSKISIILILTFSIVFLI